MNIKTLGFGLAIASCLSSGLVSYSADKQQPKSSELRATAIDLDRLPQQLNRVPGSIASIGAGAKSYPLGFVAATGEQDRIRLFEKSKDTVVTIKAPSGTGSGFIISKDGLVVTNKHVVKNEEAQIANKVTIVLADGTEIAANVLGVSRHQDLALIRILKQSRLKSLQLAKPEAIKVGQNVYALSSSLQLGIETIFTKGVLNKIGKSTSDLYHDAQISRGNSGGPLVNSRGEVIGVSYDGLSKQPNYTTSALAIKIDRVYEMLANYRIKHSNFISIR